MSEGERRQRVSDLPAPRATMHDIDVAVPPGATAREHLAAYADFGMEALEQVRKNRAELVIMRRDLTVMLAHVDTMDGHLAELEGQLTKLLDPPKVQ